MKIKDVKLKHIEPIDDGDFKVIGGTVAIVTLSNNEEIVFQLEKNLEGHIIFYHPDWQLANKSLKKAVKAVLAWEKSYKKTMKKIDNTKPMELIDLEKFRTKDGEDEIPF